MKHILGKTSIDFQGKRHVAMTLSGIAIFIGLLSLVLHGGPNQSIDFTGGLSMLVRFEAPEGKPHITEEMVRQSLDKIDLANSEVKLSRSPEGEDLLIRVKEEGRFRPPEALIRAKLEQLIQMPWQVILDEQLAPEDMPDLTGFSYVAISSEASADELKEMLATVEINNPKVYKHLTIRGDDIFILAGEGKGTVSRLRKLFAEDYGDYKIDVRNIDRVGPRIGSELRRKAVLSILAALTLIVFYLWWRFELLFGIAAVIALFHDVMITIGIFSLLNIEISLTIIGAFLTLVGYSLNDTIVVFDRIREN
ncbi:MAG: protein translocase subunit SecF, partial [Desulfobulbaceae bacterium]|nr:protein translocase subunit SecF [Desulfobulbaceae bacterium]